MLSKSKIDLLNFDKDYVILLLGNNLPDFPLAEPLSDHKLKHSSFTEMVRELDLAVKSSIQAKSTLFGIYGFCDLPMQNDNYN